MLTLFVPNININFRLLIILQTFKSEQTSKEQIFEIHLLLQSLIFLSLSFSACIWFWLALTRLGVMCALCDYFVLQEFILVTLENSHNKQTDFNLIHHIFPSNKQYRVCSICIPLAFLGSNIGFCSFSCFSLLLGTLWLQNDKRR